MDTPPEPPAPPRRGTPRRVTTYGAAAVVAAAVSLGVTGLINAYRSADAFIFPSTTETFGLVALEAMACGLPVIAARSGGVLDTVRDGYNGFFFDPAHPEQMGELVRCLRLDPARHAQMSANALAHARSQSWRATMDQLIDYYRLAIRVHAGGQAAAS